MTDPLNINIDGSGVETTLPLLPEQDYALQITESVIQPNKKQTGLNWHLKLVTTSPATAVDGRPVSPNFPVFLDIALQPAEGAEDPEGFKRNLFAAVDVVFDCDATSRPKFTKELADSAVGKTVTAHVTIDEWQGNKNNKIKRLKKTPTA